MNEKLNFAPPEDLSELIAEELKKKDKLHLYKGTLLYSLTLALDPVRGAFCFDGPDGEQAPVIPREALRHAYTGIMTMAALAASCDMLSLNELEASLKENFQARANKINLPEDETNAYFEIIDNFLLTIRNQTTDGSQTVEKLISLLPKRH